MCIVFFLVSIAQFGGRQETDTSESYATIDDFVRAFQEVYGHLDRRRSVEQMWLQVVEESSSVAEAVREVNYLDVLSHLANTFCWICGLVARCQRETDSVLHFNKDFSSVIWNKYPGRCPLCESNPCQCLIRKREIDSRSSEEKARVYQRVKRRAQRSLDDRVRNLDRLVNMFEDVYGPTYFVVSIEEITFHFTEEVGEVAEQIREARALEIASIGTRNRKRERRRIVNDYLSELADVFSWMCAILIKINYMIAEVNHILGEFSRSQTDYHEISLSEVIKKYYLREGRLVCRTCRQRRCDIKKHEKLYQFRELN